MRKMYQIVALDTKTLDHREFYQLVTETKEVLATFTKANKQETVYSHHLTAITDLLTKMEISLHHSRSSKVVSQLEEADRNRDDALVTLIQLVKAFARVKETETKAAYNTLSELLKHYKMLAAESYEKETEGINHLLNQLKESNNQSAVTRLHLTVHVEALKTAQKQFEKLYKERLAEQSGQISGQSRTVRRQLQEHYDFIVDFTGINAYAYPDRAIYATLRTNLNVIRERYRQLQPKKVKKTTATDTETVNTVASATLSEVSTH